MTASEHYPKMVRIKYIPRSNNVPENGARPVGVDESDGESAERSSVDSSHLDDEAQASQNSSQSRSVAASASTKPAKPAVDMTLFLPTSVYIQDDSLYTQLLSLPASPVPESYIWQDELAIAFIVLLGDARKKGLITSAGLDHIDKQSQSRLWHFIRSRLCETGFFFFVHNLSDDVLEAKYKAELDTTYKPYKRLVDYRHFGMNFKMDQNGQFTASDRLWATYLLREGNDKDIWLCEKGMPLWRLYEAAFGEDPAPGKTGRHGELNPPLTGAKNTGTTNGVPSLGKDSVFCPQLRSSHGLGRALPFTGPTLPSFRPGPKAPVYMPEPGPSLPESSSGALPPEIWIGSTKYKLADSSPESLDASNISTSNKRRRTDCGGILYGGGSAPPRISTGSHPASNMHDAGTKRMWAYEAILNLRLAPEMTQAARLAFEEDCNVVDALRYHAAGTLFDWCTAELPRYYMMLQQ